MYIYIIYTEYIYIYYIIYIYIMNIPVLAIAIASGHGSKRLVLMFEEVLQAFGTQFSDGLAKVTWIPSGKHTKSY